MTSDMFKTHENIEFLLKHSIQNNQKPSKNILSKSRVILKSTKLIEDVKHSLAGMERALG